MEKNPTRVIKEFVNNRMHPKYTDTPQTHNDKKECIGLNPAPHYGYRDTKYHALNLNAKFTYDESLNQTVIRLPGDISQMSRVQMSLKKDTPL